MRALALALALVVCAAPAAPPPPPAASARPRAAIPTTRLVLPAARDLDCADFPGGSAAQRALRPGDPDRLDADRDGAACEKLRR